MTEVFYWTNVFQNNKKRDNEKDDELDLFSNDNDNNSL